MNIEKEDKSVSVSNAKPSLVELIELLKTQLCLAESGKLDEIPKAIDRINVLLDGLSACPHQNDLGPISREIQKLYDKLSLIIATQKNESFEDLKKLRWGKKTLQGYKNSQTIV